MHGPEGARSIQSAAEALWTADRCARARFCKPGLEGVRCRIISRSR
jgi:hypothetical protein